jgi:hypothetical protein
MHPINIFTTTYISSIDVHTERSAAATRSHPAGNRPHPRQRRSRGFHQSPARPPHSCHPRKAFHPWGRCCNSPCDPRSLHCPCDPRSLHCHHLLSRNLAPRVRAPTPPPPPPLLTAPPPPPPPLPSLRRPLDPRPILSNRLCAVPWISRRASAPRPPHTPRWVESCPRTPPNLSLPQPLQPPPHPLKRVNNWIVKNSWGYIRLKRDVGTQGDLCGITMKNSHLCPRRAIQGRRFIRPGSTHDLRSLRNSKSA